MADDSIFSILNLRDGGELKLIFPEEIGTEDWANWRDSDVATGMMPLLFANYSAQQITIRELCIDNTRTNESVEPTIEKLRSWMRTKTGEASPPPLQLLTPGWRQRAIMTALTTKRTMWTKEGICIRAYITLTFDEMPSVGVQIDATTRRRSGNSLSGRT